MAYFRAVPPIRLDTPFQTADTGCPVVGSSDLSPSTKPDLLKIYKDEVISALGPLLHSWEKLKGQGLPDLSKKSLDELEAWEAFASRFARLTDILLSKYLRFLILQKDPGFRGEIRDYLDMAEKNALVSDADTWMKIRELRNKIAHEYTKEDLQKTLKDILQFTPFVLSELKGLQF